MFNGMMMTGYTVDPGAPEPDPDIITVPGGSGPTYQASKVGSNSTLDLKFDNDGNEYVRKNGGAYVQTNTADSWIRPTTSAPGLYKIRYTSATGDTTYLSSTAAEDIWYDLSSGDYILSIFDSTPFFGGKSATFTIEVRLDDGSVLDSGSYTISADREDS